jgi:hypothetical protein
LFSLKKIGSLANTNISQDAVGLIYAHSGNEGFDHDKYKTFPEMTTAS